MISVILCFYNREKYIKKCLDSIINQTYKDLEIIIINDGSTDNTLSICESYKDKRIKIFNQKHIGITLSRNVGIENAHGDYLYFIDSDDFIELDTLEYLYNLCEKYNTKIATSRCLDIYNYDFCVKNNKEKVKVISSQEMLEKILLWDNRAEAVWNKLVKKELFDNLRFEDRIINDIAFSYKMVLKTNKIAFSNQIKYYYLKHNENLSLKRRYDLDRNIDLYNVLFERYENIKCICPNLIANRIGVIFVIARFYLLNDKRLIDFMDNQNTFEKCKELFTLKLFKCHLGFREKLKLVIFRINPKLYVRIIDFYLKIMRKTR